MQSSNPTAEADPKQVIRLTVRDNGDVRWTIESRFLLTNESETAVFREYADQVEAGERPIKSDPEQFEHFRRIAQQETGREMSIEDVQWNEPRIIDSSTDGDDSNEVATTNEDVQIGVVSYSFTWTNFATVDSDRIHVGDAFQSEHGTWMGLTAGQRLVIEAPSKYALETPTQLSWDGPYDFTTDELEIVFVRTGTVPLSMSGWLIGGALVIVAAIGTGGYLLAQRDGKIESQIPTDRLPSLKWIGFGDRDPNDHATPATDTANRSEPATGVNSSSGSTTTGKSVAEDSDGERGHGTSLEFEESDHHDIDPELLSDEERVLRLLKQNGGRMKQASIVSETGWSNAKVSQLLSKMDDDGEIEKLRIGRENLITLPGVDLTNFD
ncbi:helix-turn-helix transcriptional regulator [Natrinema sp. HArc-T2]|uniref:helix-turn-helix transcriptional regulator n=1 Tax=Natrinema sp. HArc-T2 TaxID=3242701 RepID=UPI00359E7FC4